MYIKFIYLLINIFIPDTVFSKTTIFKFKIEMFGHLNTLNYTVYIHLYSIII